MKPDTFEVAMEIMQIIETEAKPSMTRSFDTPTVITTRLQMRLGRALTSTERHFTWECWEDKRSEMRSAN